MLGVVTVSCQRGVANAAGLGRRAAPPAAD
jgi:hypothetical protein